MDGALGKPSARLSTGLVILFFVGFYGLIGLNESLLIRKLPERVKITLWGIFCVDIGFTTYCFLLNFLKKDALIAMIWAVMVYIALESINLLRTERVINISLGILSTFVALTLWFYMKTKSLNKIPESLQVWFLPAFFIFIVLAINFLLGDVLRKLSSKIPQTVKNILFGIFFMLLLFLIWYHAIGGNPLNELALIRRAQITTGTLVETFEEEREKPEYSGGGEYYIYKGVYVYRLPFGREFKVVTESDDNQFEKQVEVEYLPDNPAISRVKGDGCQSIIEFLWRKAGLGSILLAIFMVPCIQYIKRNMVKH